MTDFQNEVAQRINAVASDKELNHASREFLLATLAKKYSYNFFPAGSSNHSVSARYSRLNGLPKAGAFFIFACCKVSKSTFLLVLPFLIIRQQINGGFRMPIVIRLDLCFLKTPIEEL